MNVDHMDVLLLSLDKRGSFLAGILEREQLCRSQRMEVREVFIWRTNTEAMVKRVSWTCLDLFFKVEVVSESRVKVKC